MVRAGSDDSPSTLLGRSCSPRRSLERLAWPYCVDLDRDRRQALGEADAFLQRLATSSWLSV